MTTLSSTYFQEQPARLSFEPSQAGLEGAIVGAPRILVRVENLAVFAAALVAYAQSGAGWGLFCALFLLPDLSLLGYLAGARIGAVSYNAAHSYVGPALLALLGLALPGLWPWVALWIAHIGLDRALGYGLKYASAFGDTHLGRVGRLGRSQAAAAPRN
jgi:Domain of unknown function (DUF4260)